MARNVSAVKYLCRFLIIISAYKALDPTNLNTLDSNPAVVMFFNLKRRLQLSRNRAQKAQRRMTPVENTINFNQAQRQYKPKAIDLIPRTRNQERLVMALQDSAEHIVVTVGPAGTGKT